MVLNLLIKTYKYDQVFYRFHRHSDLSQSLADLRCDSGFTHLAVVSNEDRIVI